MCLAVSLEVSGPLIAIPYIHLRGSVLSTSKEKMEEECHPVQRGTK